MSSYFFVWGLEHRLVDGPRPSVLLEGVRGQHEHHNQQNNDKEENKCWFGNFTFTVTTTIRCYLRAVLHLKLSSVFLTKLKHPIQWAMLRLM